MSVSSEKAGLLTVRYVLSTAGHRLTGRQGSLRLRGLAGHLSETHSPGYFTAIIQSKNTKLLSTQRNINGRVMAKG